MGARLVPFVCLAHMLAIFWWNVPQHYANIRYDQDYDDTPLFNGEHSILDAASIGIDQPLSTLLNHYIDITGSQQYWDFFAPASPKTHQYFSVCTAINQRPVQGEIRCVGQPLLSNFYSADSRWYRLTENLTGLNNPELLQAFTQHYQTQNATGTSNKPAWLILHQFELAPRLKGLAQAGYRMDSVLVAGNH